jgi:hypothetical protein
MPKKDFAFARLQKILQRLKSLILKDLDPLERQNIKAKLLSLQAAYQAGKLNFDDYKIQAITTLIAERDQCWTEQFLYRETGNFFTQAEKFLITDGKTG